MNLLIISDLHLTDKFNQKRFDQLFEIFSKVDQVILNGDFWDSYRCSFDDFVTSEWSKLFPLLITKKTIYLYGNHDLESDCNEKVNLFSVEQGIIKEIKWKDKILHIEHGNKLVPGFMEEHPQLRRNKVIFKSLLIAHLTREWILDLLFPPKMAYHRIAKALTKKVYENKKENELWILGHSHVAHFNLNKGYINLGASKKKIQYILINDDKVIRYGNF